MIIIQLIKKKIYTLFLIGVSFIVGVYFKYFTNYKDHPIEEFVENILALNGIEVDFSKNKKEKNKKD